MIKRRVKVPNVVNGGKAHPLGNNLYYITGKSHEQGGVDIGSNPKTGLEVEGGEVMQMGDKDVKVFSRVNFLGGKSPADLVLEGQSPDKVFKAQERFKRTNGLNDDGSRKARYGIWDTIKKGFTRATIGAAMADSPAVMTASGWRKNEKGDYVQDKQNSKGTTKLRKNLADISMMSPTNPVTAATDAVINKAVKAGAAGIKYLKAKKVTNKELDWSPQSWFKDAAKRETWTAEDEAILASHVPEYKSIEQQAKTNGTWLKMQDGSTWQGDPREWVMMQSNAAKQNLEGNYFWHGEKNHYSTSDESKDALGETLAKKVLWGNTNPRVGASYGFKNYPMMLGKNSGTPAKIIDAKGSDWRSISKNTDGFIDTNDFSYNNLKRDNHLVIKNVVDPGYYLRRYTANPKTRKEIPPFNKPRRKGEELSDYINRAFIGDDIILGEDVKRKSLLGNNGNFDLTKRNIFKAAIPVTGVIAAYKNKKRMGGKSKLYSITVGGKTRLMYSPSTGGRTKAYLGVVNKIKKGITKGFDLADDALKTLVFDRGNLTDDISWKDAWEQEVSGEMEAKDRERLIKEGKAIEVNLPGNKKKLVYTSQEAKVRGPRARTFANAVRGASELANKMKGVTTAPKTVSRVSKPNYGIKGETKEEAQAAEAARLRIRNSYRTETRVPENYGERAGRRITRGGESNPRTYDDYARNVQAAREATTNPKSTVWRNTKAYTKKAIHQTNSGIATGNRKETIKGATKIVGPATAITGSVLTGYNLGQRNSKNDTITSSKQNNINEPKQKVKFKSDTIKSNIVKPDTIRQDTIRQDIPKRTTKPSILQNKNENTPNELGEVEIAIKRKPKNNNTTNTKVTPKSTNVKKSNTPIKKEITPVKKNSISKRTITKPVTNNTNKIKDIKNKFVFPVPKIESFDEPITNKPKTINPIKNTYVNNFIPQNTTKNTTNKPIDLYNGIWKNSPITTEVPKDSLYRKTYDNAKANTNNNSKDKDDKEKFPRLKKFFKDKNNVRDTIGLASNTLSSITGALINRGMLNDLKEPSAPMYKPAAKLKTRININPQLDKMRETAAAYEDMINNNTASSNVGLSRIQRNRFNNALTTNELYGTKENLETELINKDKLNQQSVAGQNVDTYNNWRDKVTAFNNTIREKRSENVNNTIGNINAGIQDIITRRDRRDAENMTIRAMASSSPNSIEYMHKMGFISDDDYKLLKQQV